MKCAEFENQLWDFVENPDKPQFAPLKQHVATCEKCSKLAAQFGAELNFMAAHQQLLAPQGFEHAVMQRIAAQQTSLQKAPRIRLAAAGWWAAAAIVVGVTLGIAMGNSYQHSYSAGNESQYYFDDFQQEGIEYNLLAEN